MKRECARWLVAASVFLGAPGLALACPVCFSAKNEATRVAFLGTTVFLTALPLILIGGVLLWLLKRSEAADRAEAPPQAAPVAASGEEPETTVVTRIPGAATRA